MREPIIFGIDFDGTIVEHDYPYIGKPIPYAIDTMKLLLARGDLIILNTMRSGIELEDAVRYINSRGVELYGINENPMQKSWTTSPKVYAHYYIDDASLGCPLITFTDDTRPFVNWLEIRKLLFKGV